MSSTLRDIQYSVRTLRKNPVFAVSALLCLALGIGANTAIFSVVNAVLLRPLPFVDQERLVTFRDREGFDYYFAFAPAAYLDLREWSESLEQLAGHRSFNVNLTGAGVPERIGAQSVSPGFFQVFGAEPHLGRWFASEGDLTAEGVRSVVLSYGSWQRRFGAEPSIIGRTLTLNDQPHTVVGVAPPSFRYPENSEMWIRSYRYGVPEPPVDLGADLSVVRDLGYFQVVGRLASGRSLESAQAEIDVIGRRLAEARGGRGDEPAFALIMLREELVGDVQPALLLLLGAVGLVLLVACANVANLLLARATTREREVAVRVSLGAGRGRLVRQLLTENALLGFFGGGMGLLLAAWGVDVLVRLAPDDLPRVAEIAIDNWVLLFTLGISIGTGLAVGLVPALQASRPDVQGSLREGGRGGTEGLRKRRLRGALVVAEVALSLALVCGAALLIKSLFRLQSVELGFQPERLLVMRITLPDSRYPDEERQAEFARAVTERVRGLPGVEGAGVALALPFSGMAATLRFSISGRPTSPEDDLVTEYQVVTPDYFRAMGIPLLRGRAFDATDDTDSPLVAVINSEMAEWQFRDTDPIGQRIAFGGESNTFEIVGVVGSVRHFAFEQAPRPEIYVPYSQDPWPFMALIVRSQGDPEALVGAVRNQVLAVDPDQPVYAVNSMRQVLSESIKGRRFTALLLSLFAVVAMALATLGIYGVMSYSVSQRIHEIGIRMALGARRETVLRAMVGWALRMVVLGTAIGLAVALALGRSISSLLYGVSPADPWILASVTLLLVSAATVAAYVPARRASKVDPLVALRKE